MFQRPDSRNPSRSRRLNQGANPLWHALQPRRESMNFRLVSVALAAPVCLLASEPERPKPKVTQESLAVLRQTFIWQPSIRREAEQKKAAGPDIVTMDRFVVTESLRQKELTAKLARDAQKKKDEQFTPTKGGTFLELGRLNLGAWPDPEGRPPGFKLLKIKF